jgi:hypothetical protein
MRTLPVLFLTSAAALFAQQKEILLNTEGGPGGAPATLAFVVGGELLGGPTVTGAPYSAEAVTETTQTLADGNRIVNKSTSKIYRDSAGRERREQSLPPSLAKIGARMPGDNGPATVMISDPVAKTNYSLDLNAKRATKMPGPFEFPLVAGRGEGAGRSEVKKGIYQAQTFTVNVAGGGRGAAGGNVMVYSTKAGPGETPNSFKTDDLGSRMIEGVSAQGTRTTVTIPAGQVGNDRPIEVVSETWYSPDLKVVMMTKHNDPRAGETVYQLMNVTRSEPLQSLFEVPPDFQVTDMKARGRVAVQPEPRQ